MATFSKQLLSGSTNGRPIKITTIATAGTLIHTVDSSDIDEIWLYAINTTSVNEEIVIELGGVSNPDDHIVVTITAKAGLTQVIPGLPLNGGVVVRVFTENANAVNIVGWVNRITE